jgi:hypothetical protein
MRRRLLEVLHLGLVELRLLALAGKGEQVADLADALEIVPRYVEECDAEGVELIRFVLKNYEGKYPNSGANLVSQFEGDVLATA